MVEVVSCLESDGRPVFRDLRWGVYAVVKPPNDYARTCFKEYGLKTDASGWYANHRGCRLRRPAESASATESYA